MYYCNKCNKEVDNKKDLYKGLCQSCYHDYLIEKIENLGNPEFLEKDKNNFSIKNSIKEIFEKIKDFFGKKK